MEREATAITMQESNHLNTNEVTTVMKERIAAEVKKMAPQIDHVYVSANPDFITRMTSYMEDVGSATQYKASSLNLTL